MKTDEFNAIFAALADPTRRAIVSRLAQGEATVGELAEPFEMTLPGISKHLRVLKAAGLVTQTRDAQRRPCQLNFRPLREVAEWAETFRANWEDSYSRLDDYMREVQEARVTTAKKDEKTTGAGPDA
ncbi:ArsR/SmtB family transcription factor [Nocardia brevicatena]|uniref:ArsR/SmtB family transcription factor n=1 Tax=Nocardia brevicatena TaxID=37327 RepID=UPI0002FED060|nr:metalloregulator ArsR/SmtB family transcription factor [Nocardia brevicatena]